MNDDEKTKKYKQKIFDKYGNEFSILSEYKGFRNEVIIRHNKCGNKWSMKPDNFQGKCRFCCPKTNKRKDIKTFKKEVESLTNNEYSCIDNTYINNKTKILIKHNTCGYEYKVRPDLFIRGSRCPICTEKKRKESLINKNILNECLENAYDGDEYMWLGTLGHNNKEKVLIKHLKCGYEYKVRPNDFQQGYRCPNCSTHLNSKNIIFIKNFLNKNNIEYKTEFTLNYYDERKRFDFLILDNIVLEYDGIQHFKLGKHSIFTELSVVKRRDKEKNDIMFRISRFIFIRLHYKLKQEEIKIILEELIQNKCLSEKTINEYKLLVKQGNKIYNEKDYYINLNKNYFDN